MSEQAENKPPDFVQLWRDWVTQSERQFSAFFNDSMNSEAFARTMGGQVEMYATFQRMLADGMERYLSMMNMPSRTDIVGLGETLRSLEARLARIEETLQIAAEAVDSDGRKAAPPTKPARTRRPAGAAAAEETPEETPEEGAIPKELRR